MKLVVNTFLLTLILVSFSFAQNPVTQNSDMQRGMILLQERKLDEAIKAFNKALKINPRNNAVLYLRGTAKFFKRDFKGAMADFNKSIKIAPNAKGAEQVYSNRGNLYYMSLQKDKAFLDYDKAISLNPNYAPPYVGRGNYFAEKGKLQKAFSDYNKAIELNPKSIAAYLGRADVFFTKNELDKSLVDLEKAQSLGDNNASNYLQVGMILGLKGYWFSAEENLKKGITLNQNSLSLTSHNIVVSLSDFDKYILKNPKNAKAYAIRGLIKLIQKNENNAVEDFKKAFSLDSKLKTDLSSFIKPIEEKLNTSPPN